MIYKINKKMILENDILAQTDTQFLKTGTHLNIDDLHNSAAGSPKTKALAAVSAPTNNAFEGLGGAVTDPEELRKINLALKTKG